MRDCVEQALAEAAEALDRARRSDAVLDAITRAGELLAGRLEQGGRAFSCGNGGSMCDAMHFAEELSGRFRNDRPGMAATAISDPSHISCVANDYGYEQVFSRYLEAHARSGDVLLAISTSGTSGNVVRAAEVAGEMGVHCIALTGHPGRRLGELAEVEICTPGGRYADRVQEMHIKVIHILIELTERIRYPDTPQ
ncbi:MAG: SIS domain-containing protein [Gammaproteobacteria bacterium AqS3]|nr:SIS domain-containing protein [Gammaproteobacteria bacterium AqS3]